MKPTTSPSATWIGCPSVIITNSRTPMCNIATVPGNASRTKFISHAKARWVRMVWTRRHSLRSHNRRRSWNKQNRINRSQRTVLRSAIPLKHRERERAFHIQNLRHKANNYNLRRTKSIDIKGKPVLLRRNLLLNLGMDCPLIAVLCRQSAAPSRLLQRNGRTEYPYPGSAITN